MLEELHNAIQTAVGFEHDHMFTFYLSRTDDSQKREYLHDEDYSVVIKTIKEVFPLDVLQNYTSYKLAFKLANNGKEWDDNLMSSQALSSEAIRKGLKAILLGPAKLYETLRDQS